VVDGGNQAGRSECGYCDSTPEDERTGDPSRHGAHAGNAAENYAGPAALLHERDDLISLPCESLRRDLCLPFLGVDLFQGGRLQEFLVDMIAERGELVAVLVLEPPEGLRETGAAGPGKSASRTPKNEALGRA